MRAKKWSRVRRGTVAASARPEATRTTRTFDEPGRLTPARVLHLQRTVGNHVVARLVARTASPRHDNRAHKHLPDRLQRGIESLSGVGLDDVRVHYNSDKPARYQAYAYAQGTDIHLAPGQERCLPHEA